MHSHPRLEYQQGWKQDPSRGNPFQKQSGTGCFDGVPGGQGGVNGEAGPSCRREEDPEAQEGSFSIIISFDLFPKRKILNP